MRGRKARFFLLDFHVAREFILNFLVSFMFFFFIFFINQILLLVQQVLLKNVDIKTIIILVLSAVPQFLQYVVPFATLSASSMVLGDLGANNELMALRSSGINLTRVYKVLIILSLALCLLTFYISDYLMPLSSRTYQEMLTNVMRDLPTFEITPDTTNSVGDVVMRNGDVEGDEISDIILFTNNSEPYMSVTSPRGKLELIDPANFIYALSLDDARLLLSEDNINSSMLSDSERAVMYLDFSDQVPSLTSSDPSNLSNRELWPLMESRREMRDRDVEEFHRQREESLMRLASDVVSLEHVEDLEMKEDSLEREMNRLEALGDDEPIQFYYQYYSAEFNKKFALALAPLALTVATLPLSLIKIKHGRLVGFGLSLLIAVSYWYILFFSQLKIFDYSFNAGILMYIADAVMIAAGLILLFLKRRTS